MRTTIGVVAGSFDPITLGHIYVIKEALKLVDLLYVLVATNPNKNHMLDSDTRKFLVDETLLASLEFGDYGKLKVMNLPKGQFTAKFAASINARFIFRGIRNVVDFEYENAQQLINKQVAPSVTTVFLMPPSDLVGVSSSALRSMVGLQGWERAVANWLPIRVIETLKSQFEGN